MTYMLFLHILFHTLFMFQPDAINIIYLCFFVDFDNHDVGKVLILANFHIATGDLCIM